MGGRRSLVEESTRAASAGDLETFAIAESDLAKLQVPVLYQHANPTSRLYVASFDGTGRDVTRPNEVPTNVGVIHRQMEDLAETTTGRVAGGYVAGPGTQDEVLVRTADSIFAFSYDERIADAYRQLSRQVRRWLEQDPNAEISIAAIGYSRGATLIPGFARLVERHGVLDPAGLSFHKDANGELVATSPRPPLVPPGRIAQAALLFDPVSTNLPEGYDLRLPSSVISGYSLLARDERRVLFAHTAMMGDGVTPDGRFGRSTVAGAHADIGGGTLFPGLEIRSGNLGVRFINALMDPPLLQERPVPQDPAQNVIHSSERGMLGLYAIGAAPLGQRYMREQLCVVVDPCTDAMPRDEALAARFEYRHPLAPQLAPALQASELLLDDPSHPGHALFRQAREGMHALDARLGRVPDAGSDRLAAALAVAAQQGGLRAIDHVAPGDDGRRMFAVQGLPQDPAQRRAWVETVPALAQSLAESTRQMDQLPAAAIAPPVSELARLQGQPQPQPQLAPTF